MKTNYFWVIYKNSERENSTCPSMNEGWLSCSYRKPNLKPSRPGERISALYMN